MLWRELKAWCHCWCACALRLFSLARGAGHVNLIFGSWLLLAPQQICCHALVGRPHIALDQAQASNVQNSASECGKSSSALVHVIFRKWYMFRHTFEPSREGGHRGDDSSFVFWERWLP